MRKKDRVWHGQRTIEWVYVGKNGGYFMSNCVGHRTHTHKAKERLVIIVNKQAVKSTKIQKSLKNIEDKTKIKSRK